MRNWFVSRGYPPKVIDEQILRAENTDGQKTQGDENKGPVLVTTYHPALKNISKILSKHSNLLQIDEE